VKAGGTAEALVEAATAGRRRWVTVAAGLALVVVLALVVRACRQPDAGAEAFCAEVQRIRTITTAEQLQGQGGQATLAELRSALGQLRTRSPGAVRGDVATLADVTGRLQDALDQQDRGNQAERDRATAELDASLAAFEQASARVVDYAQRTCGVDLDG
jgi:transposase